MRIISGVHKGRTITAPNNLPVRPTTDFAKVALFNILCNHFELTECMVLDLFAGTGSISYEFASRECAGVDTVELGFKQCAFIKQTATQLKMEQLRCYRQNALQYLESCIKTYDIIFADPPYDMPQIDQVPTLVFARSLLNPQGWLILEHSKAWDFSSTPYFKICRQYGSVHFSIFANQTTEITR